MVVASEEASGQKACWETHKRDELISDNASFFPMHPFRFEHRTGAVCLMERLGKRRRGGGKARGAETREEEAIRRGINA